MKQSVVGFGNALLDISAHVPTSMFNQYNVVPGSIVLADDKHLPIYEALANMKGVEFIAGGATLNSIRVCQWMLQYPRATSYIGSIGNDKFGEILKESAKNDGVEAYFHIDQNQQTGTCAVLIKDHERSLIANLGAANQYKHEHSLREDVQAVLSSARVVYIAGFFLTVCPSTIMHVARVCNADNTKTFVINLSAPFICEIFKDRLMEALKYCHLVIGNETEAAAYAESQSLMDHSPVAVAKAIAVLPQADVSRQRICIITQGAGNTIAAQADGTVTEFPVIPVPTNELVDLNGAGDAFVGGLISFLVQNKSLPEAIAAGHYAASYIVRRSGCSLAGKPCYA